MTAPNAERLTKKMAISYIPHPIQLFEPIGFQQSFEIRLNLSDLRYTRKIMRIACGISKINPNTPILSLAPRTWPILMGKKRKHTVRLLENLKGKSGRALKRLRKDYNDDGESNKENMVNLFQSNLICSCTSTFSRCPK